MKFQNIIIENKSLKEIEYHDSFFDSLREDYYNFNDWYKLKMNNDYKAYVTYNNKKLSSFLLLKIENKEEDYKDFEIPFNKEKRLKICTFKVEEKNKNIGKTFLDIIEKTALDNNIKEVYITINKKYISLINYLKKYNFNYYGEKFTKNGNGNIIKEQIYLKKLNKE